MPNEDKIPPERLLEEYIQVSSSSNPIKEIEVVQEYPAIERPGVLYVKVES